MLIRPGATEPVCWVAFRLALIKGHFQPCLNRLGELAELALDRPQPSYLRHRASLAVYGAPNLSIAPSTGSHTPADRRCEQLGTTRIADQRGESRASRSTEYSVQVSLYSVSLNSVLLVSPHVSVARRQQCVHALGYRLYVLQSPRS